MALTTLLALAAFAPGAPPPTGDTVALRYKVYRDFDLELPAERFTRLSGSFPVVGATGERMGVALEGTSLAIDTDGDGATELALAPAEDDAGVRTATVVLRGVDAEGNARPYAARLKDEGAGWHFAASGAAVGKIGDVQVRIVDQDNDGRYDGYGTDAIVVGSGDRASYLSRVISVAGALHAIDVAADGTSLTVAPYAGETGELDLATELDTKAKLLWAVVQSADGELSFDLAAAGGPLTVPAGEYWLRIGKLGLGESTVTVTTGRAEPLVVPAGERVAHAWGGPTRAEFAYEQKGTQLVLDPDRVWYYGAGGEQYAAWTPRGKSPEFTVKERAAGTELLKAVFPGTC